MAKRISEEQLRQLAALRAAGLSWEQAARELGRDQGIIRQWVHRYRRNIWPQILEEARAEVAAAAMAESLASLRGLLRHTDATVRQKAAQALLQHHARLAGSPPRSALRAAASAEVEPETLQLASYVTRLSDDQIDSLVETTQTAGTGDSSPHGPPGPS